MLSFVPCRLCCYEYAMLWLWSRPWQMYIGLSFAPCRLYEVFVSKQNPLRYFPFHRYNFLRFFTCQDLDTISSSNLCMMYDLSQFASYILYRPSHTALSFPYGSFRFFFKNLFSHLKIATIDTLVVVAFNLLFVELFSYCHYFPPFHR